MWHKRENKSHPSKVQKSRNMVFVQWHEMDENAKL